MNKKNNLLRIVGNLLSARYGYDAGGVEDSKKDHPEKRVFLPSWRKWIKSFSEDKKLAPT